MKEEQHLRKHPPEEETQFGFFSLPPWEEEDLHPRARLLEALQDDTFDKFSKHQNAWEDGLTRPSPCSPSILLKITSKVRGRIPALPGALPPWIV